MQGHHHHDEHRHDRHALPASGRAFAIGVTLNLAFVAAELAFGYDANSLALISDASHNFSDVIGLLLAWGASHLATSLPTARRTYGWRKTSVMAALANALLLMTVVGGITWEAADRFSHPEKVASVTVIWVAAIGVLINGATAMLFMAGRENDINIRGAYLHMAADALVSLGVVAAGVAISFTGWLWLDPAMSLTVGVVIAVGTWGLLRESANLSLDAVPDGIDLLAVEAWLKARPGVVAVHDLHIWAMSTTEVALTVHLVMNPVPADDGFLHEIAHELHEHFDIDHATTQIEHGSAGIDCHLAPSSVV